MNKRRPGEEQPTAEEMFSQVFWDERYGAQDRLWSGKPNLRLLEQAAELTPGRALDVGCGEGADAIWLADRGWQVTAVDFSAVALRRGGEHAAQTGSEIAARIEWRQEDLLSWTPDPGSFQLVSSQFMHLPPEPRRALFRRLADGVAPGGTLLIVGHHPSHLRSAAHTGDPEKLYASSEVAELLDPRAWEIVVEADPERSITGSDGEARATRDAVLRARRRREPQLENQARQSAVTLVRATKSPSLCARRPVASSDTNPTR